MSLSKLADLVNDTFVQYNSRCTFADTTLLTNYAVSGLSGSKEVAQNQVLIGMGLLAGSTVMLITLLWGSCVVVGKCDLLENSTSVDSQDTNGFSLFGMLFIELPQNYVFWLFGTYPFSIFSAELFMLFLCKVLFIFLSEIVLIFSCKLWHVCVCVCI